MSFLITPWFDSWFPRAISALWALLLANFSLHAASPHSSVEAEARRFELAPGLRLSVWASEPQLENPVAFSLVAEPAESPGAPTGITAYVAETHRYGISILDITQNTRWLLNDLSFRSVADRVAFLENEFGTNRHVLTADSELVRRLTDPAATGAATESARFAAGFNSVADGTAAGVLAHEDQLYFGNIPSLWRWDRWTEPGTASASNQLAFGFGVHIGVTGHDLHGLTLGPDGRLYMSFGDRGLNITNREGTVLHLPDTGGVLRCEPDGRHLEVFCHGLRNPQELAFDDFGNLFTVDNDTAGADPCRVLHLVQGGDYGWRASYQHMKGFGPWVQEGLWTGAWDGTLPPAGTVSQGPAGLTYYPGTGFGDRFQGRFLHCDFPGGVWSFAVAPRGSSFEVTAKEKVLWNAWPTDVEFGPDGALYILDWVSGWGMPKKGRIYRITNTEPSSPIAEEVRRLLATDGSSISESEYHALLGHSDRRIRLRAQWALASKGPRAWNQLARIARTGTATLPRLHALWALGQIERAHRDQVLEDLSELIPLLSAGEPQLVIATAQLFGEARFGTARDSLIRLLDHPEAPVRMAAIQAWASMPQASDARYSRQDGPKTRVPLWRTIASWFVRDSAPPTPKSSVSGLPTNSWPEPVDYVGRGMISDAHLFHAMTLAATPPTRSLLWQSQRWLNRSADAAWRLVALRTARRATNAIISHFLDDPDPTLVVEAARAINDQPVPAALAELAAQLTPKHSDPTWLRIPNVTLSDYLAQIGATLDPAIPPLTNVATLRHQFLKRALNAHYRLGGSENASLLADFAAGRCRGQDSSTADLTDLRVEALFLLGAWEILPATPGHVPAHITPDPNHGAVPTINPENWPGWFDRVTGLWRPLPPRPSSLAHDAFIHVAESLLLDRSPRIATAALDAAVRLRAVSLAPFLLRHLRDLPTDAALRRGIPAALAHLGAPELPDAVRIALADPDAGVRASAIPYVDRLGDAAAIPLLEDLVVRAMSNPAELHGGQAALRALGQIPDRRAEQLLAAQFEALATGKLPPALELDLVVAARRQGTPELVAKLDQRQASLPSNDPLAGWREVLEGGDVSKGRTVFFEKPETQCSRCHRVTGEGGIVGPALDDVATRRDARFLLESLVHPNAQIAPGFENAALTLADGTEVAGTIRTETADTLTVESGEDGVVTVPVAKVVKRQRGLSAMPEGLADLLNRHELRDLMAYLQSLRQ